MANVIQGQGTFITMDSFSLTQLVKKYGIWFDTVDVAVIIMSVIQIPGLVAGAERKYERFGYFEQPINTKNNALNPNVGLQWPIIVNQKEYYN
jgi:hypothetical protein